jgi:hypothetical protein
MEQYSIDNPVFRKQIHKLIENFGKVNSSSIPTASVFEANKLPEPKYNKEYLVNNSLILDKLIADLEKHKKTMEQYYFKYREYEKFKSRAWKELSQEQRDIIVELNNLRNEIIIFMNKFFRK